MSSAMDTHQAAVGRLNNAQGEALREPGNTALLAGPGSGKTATLVLKIARLLDQVPAPQGVACLTYSNEAARGFESRLGELGIRKGGRLFTGTVHSFCLAQVLRPFAWRLTEKLRTVAEYDVASDDEVARARQRGLDEAGVNESENWWSAKLSSYRRIVLADPERRIEFSDDRLPAVADGYRKALRAGQRIDFDDIVALSHRLIEHDDHVRRVLAAKYPWFVIDEYQDLGLALHRIVVALIDQAGVRVFAVGDPDQSIYSFAGARPEFLDELAKRDDVRSLRLRMNYRCRQQIIDASLHVLQPDEERGFLAADLDNPNQGEIFFHKCAEGLPEQAQLAVARIKEVLKEGLSPGEIGILAVRWQDLHDFEEQLAAESVPCRLAKAKTYKPTPLTTLIEDMAAWCAGGWRRGRPRIADLFDSWEHVLVNCSGESRNEKSLAPRVELFQLLRALRDPAKEVGAWLRTVDEALGLRKLAQSSPAAPKRMRHELQELGVMLTALERSRQPLDEFSGLAANKIVLQTIHGSKGLEYSVVFVAALENGVLPKWNDDPPEARRLFYVAVTRARREVHLLWSGFFVTADGKLRQKGPSPLLLHLMQRLRSE